MAAVEIAKPDTHKRQYAYVELGNGLRAIVGSDSECDKAGAALCVNVGMCHERKDLPGLAHFLEHMLFTGTTKYPKEGEYHEFIQQNGGMANAYTTCYFTNYMFEVKPDKFGNALDRFARFFSEPLLTRACTEREINAVDSEFQAGFTQPWWRYIGIMNQSANPDHPFHVAVGNNKVLMDDPKERGIDLYEEMKKLYDSCYSANGMTLCIIAKESVEELTAMVTERFSAVVNKGVTMPIGDSVSENPPFLPADWNRLLLQNPVVDIKEFVFTWVIPYQGPMWQVKPTAYVSHLLGYEGSGSVIAVLKQKGLITGCGSGNGAWLEGAFSLLNVTFELTDKGLNNLQEIGAHLFAYIALLQKTPVEKWIFDEMKALAAMKFKFAPDQQPFDLCGDMAMSLQSHPPAEALAGDVLLYEYAPEAISDLLQKLTLDRVRVSHQSKTLADRCTDKDTSYGSPIAFLPIEADWLSDWASRASPGDGSADAAVAAAAALGLRVPSPNPFIPEDLSLRDLPAGGPPPMPVKLEVGEPGGCIANVFHRQDDVFRQPKAHVVFQLWSPFIMSSVENFVRSELWCRSVEEALNEYSYDATVAGVHYGLGLGSGCISLVFTGFNDKLGVLMGAVTEKMLSMVEVPENVYSIVADKYADDIKNTAFRSPPYAQCGMRFQELATRGLTFPSYKRHEAFQTLSRESINGLAGELFRECRVDAMVIGNMVPGDAERLALQLVSGLGLKGPVPALPERAEAVFSPGSTVWNLASTDEDDPNHAVFMRMQMPETVENEVMTCLVEKILGPKFFDVLRTQQQLGYIVQMASPRSSKFVYIVAVAQTEFPPDYARGRMIAFLDEHFQWIQEKLDEEEFRTCVEGVLSELRMKPKNLGEEYGRYTRQFTERVYDWGRRQRMVAAAEAASIDSFKAFATALRDAPRLFTQVRKVVAKDDKALPEGSALPTDPADLRKWDGHQDVVKAFKESAEWSALSA